MCTGLTRKESKARRLPSGDQTGPCSTVGAKVKRVAEPLSVPTSQMLLMPVWESSRFVAILVPSGETLGSSQPLGEPRDQTSLPDRSNQTSLVLGATFPSSYART